VSATVTADVKGRIHGRDKSRMPAVFAAVSALPGYEVTGEYLPGGWQVRYVYRNVATAAESWAVAARAIQASEATRQ
jgi:hypothetical protein